MADTKPVRWHGYPLAQHTGEFVAEFTNEKAKDGVYRLEVVRRRNRYTNGTTGWDAYVDDECIGTDFDTCNLAKLACVAHAEKLDAAGNVQEAAGATPGALDVQTP